MWNVWPVCGMTTRKNLRISMLRHISILQDFLKTLPYHETITRIPTFLLQNKWRWENQYFSPCQDFLLKITEFTFQLMIWKTWLTRKKEWVFAVCAPFSCIHAARVVYSLRKLRERSFSHGLCHSGSVYHLLSTRNIAILNSTIGISIMDFCQEKCLCKPFCCHINNSDKQVWLHVFWQEVYDLSVIFLIFL